MTGGEVVLFGLTMGELFTVGSTLVSAIGQLKAGANAQRAGNFNAQVNFNNADAARLAAIEDGKRQKRLAAKLAGKNRALDPDKLDLLEDTALEQELAFLSLIHAGEVKAVGFESNARLEIARGRAAQSSARIGAGFTLLGGVGSVIDTVSFGGVSTTPGTSVFGPPTSAQFFNTGPSG
jgi:hypothetical protein